ncbi:MAG: Ribosomal-protein-S18p-alanine acetyltransferase [uncultured Sphingosinicella sp.]|uniref:Ribosomal-protein-S18p-alanine acetyltransferase n=1 Tax=uncultured Sphingosinicella sp. TaxID=478748 RepID=A0A6J4UIC9_9SPHN|nr:ribosomal protein S18-alanine N-acetyltransferase [uncultured Sphingosinicella sp.]CAA9548897.1 MAG: Ribosomal-protein-S18p-alanine acetyltransferase [uncultured Sphingosinicella sp.]
MPGGITIVEGGVAELDPVMRVMEDSFDPAYGEAWTAAQCAGLMPMPGVWLTLARDGDEVLGFALGRIVLKEAELLLLAVRRDGQRQGIGQMLLDRFMLVATTRGADRLHLEVRDGNPAIKLYSKAGFSEVGRRRNYYTGRDGQIYDALTLTRAATF